MGFPKQEYWRGVPYPSPGDLPNSGIKPKSPALQADYLPSEPPGKPKNTEVGTHLFSRESSWPRNRTRVSCIAGRFLTNWAIREVNVKYWGFPGSSAGKESTCNVGDLGSIPGLGRSPGEGNGYPLQYSGLENSMDCIVHGVTKHWTQLSDFHFQTYWAIYLPRCMGTGRNEGRRLLALPILMIFYALVRNL